MSGTIHINRTMQPLNDQTLVERSAAGDRTAREELARACLPRVRKTVILCAGHGENTEDLVQTALIRVFGALQTFRGDCRFSTWVDRITVNTVNEHFRKRATFRRFFYTGDNEKQETTPDRESPDRMLEASRIETALAEQLSAIRYPKRVAIILSAAYGHTVSEIASIMDCTTETAKKRLQHGRRELVKRLKKDPFLLQKLTEITP